MSGGGSPTTQPQQTATTQISPQAQQLFGAAFPAISSFLANPPQRYPGQTIAAPTSAQTAAEQLMLANTQPMTDVASRATALAAQIPSMLSPQTNVNRVADAANYGITPTIEGRTLTGAGADPLSDPRLFDPRLIPGFNQAALAATNPLYEQYREQVLPGIQHQAISTGPFGGSRQYLAEGTAAGRTARAAGDVTSRMAQDVYNNNLAALMQQYGIDRNTAVSLAGLGVQARGQDVTQRAQDVSAETARYGTNIDALQNVIRATPTLQAAWGAPAQAMSQVGAAQQAREQALLDEAVNAYYYQQTAPYLAAREAIGMIPAFPGATNIASANVPKANPLLQGLGGAAAGASIGGTIFPGVGALPGAALGATLPFLMG